MKQLEQLPEITERALGGLTADQALKQRILQQAAAGQSNVIPFRRKNHAPWISSAIAAAAVLTLGLTLGIPALTRPPVQEPVTMARSAVPSVASVYLEEADYEEESVIYTAEKTLVSSPEDTILMITRKAGSGTKGRERADLGSGAFTLQTGTSSPSYRSIWAEGSSGTFPLISIDGRCYRMLNTPDQVENSLLGKSLGTVDTYTSEPALAGNKGVISNAVASGETVYSVKGMGGTFAASSVNGATRLFQRVSFNGNALRGNDTLADTLSLSGHISGMELSGVGTITDSGTCEQLFSLLINNAEYESSGSLSANKSLLIQLDNGLAVQLTVKGERFAACGVWSCPDFIEQFKQAVQ